MTRIKAPVYGFYAGNDSRIDATIPETRDEWTLQLRALRDIAPEEEITIDYDFDEIYDLCRKDNAYCLQARCPAGVVACESQGTSGRAVPEPWPA